MGTLQNAYALIIGVGNDLPITVRDATAIHNILADETLAGYKPENITLLTEKDATRNGILNAFDELISKINEESSVMLFYSGHGGLYEPWNQFYLVPNNFDPEKYEDTWVKAEELKEKIAAINSKRLIFFLDCCHAAGMTKSAPNIKSAKAKNNLNHADGLAQKIDDGKGMSILSSCREDQLSYIMQGDSNSLFTKCLIEVLKGKHKDSFNEEFVRISEVVQYIFKKVPEQNADQKPYANLQIYDDFPISYIPQNLRNLLQQQSEVYTIENNKSINNEVITIFRETENATNVLLFVHGFSGEAAKTFGKIPEYLMGDDKIDGWDIFPFGYSEHVKPVLGKHTWASIHDIEMITSHLITSIKHKYGKYKRIAIVAHSLGGIVAQRAILDLGENDRQRIKHLILFGAPSNGFKSNLVAKLLDKNLKDLSSDGVFIKNLREKWNATFSTEYPFQLKIVASTHDEFVSVDSCFKPFKPAYYSTVSGNHFSMVKPESRDNDSYQLILATLSNNTFLNEFTETEEINLVLGEYDSVVSKLLPKVNELDSRGLERLVFALEGLDRGEEALNILLQHEISKDNSDLLGVLGGRYKRRFLINYSKNDGEESMRYYSKALEIAENKKDHKQIYYHAINIAFLNLVLYEEESNMKIYAKKALDSCKKDAFNSLWKLATIAEANLYLGNFEKAKDFYGQASKLAGIREKISIHTNAYTAYVSLMQTSNPTDEFITFLKVNFLE